ncbi:4-hydroxy-3-methylbut-2-en-1-yl diphosphate synthase [Papillibacter cinnamivorans DSM 12816]|uniref:4-hydroxy-3-methylbut-2-en-1-yl diphosphate synthase (flavodoxin) n=2 Tax=Papillibacter TaxID=100175 RepID=A0A1W1YLR7_9FIRM|nr:4-hydroxy-3-methylbut-2-en-1-yl diphosphate synthase [Papillibacter cinnamivorans DSM 12816]
MTKRIIVGGVPIGGGAPVSIQSMTNTRTSDVSATVEQIRRLAAAGCHIVRLAVPDAASAEVIGEIKRQVSVPLVADIHFDYRLALMAAERGIDKIRINPGNIGGEDRVRQVAEACKSRGIPIRIGINGGSLEKSLLTKYGGLTAEAMVESAMGHIGLLNRYGFDDICVSLKASSVPLTVEACRLMAEKTDYPLHLGVTEAGTEYMGTVKSAVGIGSLLLLGIGDTIRVSLTADPVREVYAARAILKAAGRLREGAEIISCPTCGRTRIDLIGLAGEVERRLADYKGNITVAVMGCAVNGPGEASAADVGIAGGDGVGLIFRRGEILRKVPQDRLVDELMLEIRKLEESKQDE